MALKARMKILLVDSQQSMRKMEKTMLKQIGFKNIIEADNGAKAWTMIEESLSGDEPGGFVLSDWELPTLSGLELIQKIRQHNDLKKLPFLIVSADAEQSNIVKAVKSGVSNFIVKPFSVQTLKEKIHKIFN